MLFIVPTKPIVKWLHDELIQNDTPDWDVHNTVSLLASSYINQTTEGIFDLVVSGQSGRNLTPEALKRQYGVITTVVNKLTVVLSRFNLINTGATFHGWRGDDLVLYTPGQSTIVNTDSKKPIEGTAVGSPCFIDYSRNEKRNLR